MYHTLIFNRLTSFTVAENLCPEELLILERILQQLHEYDPSVKTDNEKAYEEMAKTLGIEIDQFQKKVERSKTYTLKILSDAQEAISHVFEVEIEHRAVLLILYINLRIK